MIPQGSQYMDPVGGIGKIANFQFTQADSKVVGDTSLRFGQAVQVVEGVALPFSDGVFFGVTVAKNYVQEITSEDKDGQFIKGEMVAILRKGSIWVQVDEDVKEGEQASAKSTGNFGKVSTEEGATDKAIGVYQSTAQSGGLAILQINLP